MKILKASKICEIVKGELYGDPDITISSYSIIQHAKKGDITFLQDKRHLKYLKTTKASLIITSQVYENYNYNFIVVKNPILKFAEILDLFFIRKKVSIGISQKAEIDPTCKIGKDVFIDKYAIIGKNVTIGSNCYIGSNSFIGHNATIGSSSSIRNNVTLLNDTQIGQFCTIHPGVVIGSDGFGFINNNQLTKIPQLGKVIIKNRVEIGSNTTIDRGTFENTIIGNDVKLDNLIQIGHNVKIGDNTLIAAQTGIAGSTKIGHNCMIGGQVAIAEHITIGNHVKIAGKSGVIKNISNNSIIQGPLAFNIKDFQKSYIYFKKLPHINKIISKLKK